MRRYEHLGVKWSSQGMLRLETEAMTRLFIPTLNNITKVLYVEEEEERKKERKKEKKNEVY